MEHERLAKQIKTVFTAIVNKLVDPAFKFSEGGATKKTMKRFIDAATTEFGAVTAERIVEICVYAAYRFRERQWSVKSVFGKATLSNYVSSKNGQRYYENRWLESGGLSRKKLADMIADRRAHPQSKYVYMPSEENTKKRFFGQHVGYLLCQSSTLGWSPFSAACQKCAFTHECQSETNRKYPELYRLRIEYGNPGK